MKSLFLAVAYVIIVTQSAPISVQHYTKNKTLFIRSNPLEPLSAVFFKLIPDRSTRAAHERLNTSLPVRKKPKPDLTIVPANPMLSNVTGCKFANFFTKFSYFINVPVTHPLEKYKIIVVTLPPNIKLRSGDTEPLVVYMVFDDNTAEDSRASSMPEVYFETQRGGRLDFSMKNKNEQIWIINSNRTVTGLKSKDVAKFVYFTRKRKRSEAIVWIHMDP